MKQVKERSFAVPESIMKKNAKFYQIENSIEKQNFLDQNQNKFTQPSLDQNQNKLTQSENIQTEKDYCDFGLNSSIALRNRLAKQSSASPLLMKRPYFSTTLDATLQKPYTQSPFQTRRTIPLASATSSPIAISQKRSSLLFSSNFQFVDENAELPPTLKENKLKISCSPINETIKIKLNNNQSTLSNKIVEAKNVLAPAAFLHDNNKKTEKNFKKDASKKFHNIFKNEKQIGLTQIDLSSTESLPLDVSRYDNVIPQKNQCMTFF